MKLTLVIPNESHEKVFQHYIAQWEECGEEMIPASAKTIQKCGGVLEDERENDEGIVYQRYWITL